MIWLLHQFLHYTGSNNESGPWYGFWSGFGSDLSEFALFGAVLKMVNCHEKGCWRLGHHVNGTVVCHKHRRDHNGS